MSHPNAKFPSPISCRTRLSLAALFSLAALCGAARPALALDVIGNINSDTTWKKSDSPIHLTGDVTVQSHVTLSIEPGVVVHVAATDGLGSGSDTSKVEFIVKGALIASGTATARVTIDGDSHTAGSWYGISFEPGAKESAVTFADISDATLGIYARTTASLTLADFSIANCTTALQWQTSPGPTLTRASIHNSNLGLSLADDGTSGATATLNQCNIDSNTTQGLTLATRMNAVVNRSSFTANNVAIVANVGSSLTMTNNIIAGNRAAGLTLSQGSTSSFRIINNTIDRNTADLGSTTAAGEGIQVLAVSDASKFIIRNNNITGHGTLGINVSGSVSPSLDHNNVWGNATNYSTGITAGPGSVSANPLYRTPVGNAVAGMSFSHTGYPNSDNWSFTCSEPLAIQMFVNLTSFDTESGYDYLTILDGAGHTVQSLSGPLGPMVSTRVDGTSLGLHFTSDGSGTRTGFTGNCMAVIAGVPNYRVQSSSPILDVGNSLDAPTQDFDGIARPVDGDMDGMAVIDIGAYEWHANRAPIANPGVDTTVLVNTNVNLDGSLSNDPDGKIVSYLWDFGDGSATATTMQVMHKYTALGVYTVKLTVTDDEGSTGSKTITITVTDNLPPIANPGPDQKVDPGMQVTFDGGASMDLDGTIVSYDWDYGDGTPKGSGRTVTHIYAKAGIYKAKLTVTDNKGLTGSAIATITVGNVTPLPDMAGGMTDGGTTSPDGSTTLPDGGMVPENDGSAVQVRPPGESVTGCGCRVAGAPGSDLGGLLSGLALAGLALLLARRRFAVR